MIAPMHYDVAVIGAGIMGSATAATLARRGKRVVLLEQFGVGHDRGSSHGPARIFRFSYADPTYVEMAMEALPLWREYEARSGTTLLTTTGGLDVGAGIEDNAAALEKCDAPVETLTGKEVAARWPFIAMDPDAPAVYQPDAGMIHADFALDAFVALARNAGTELEEHCRVHALEPEDGGVSLVLAERTIHCDSATVTAGAWAKALLATAGIHLDVRPTRETVVYYRNARALQPTLVEWGRPAAYALPSPGGLLKTGEHIAGPEIDPDADDGAPDRDSVARISAWIARRFPEAGPEPVHTETCLYTNTPDESFLLERHGSIIVGSPCSGHGFKFAPLIGKRLAELAIGAE